VTAVADLNEPGSLPAGAYDGFLRSDVRSYGNVLACTAFLLGLAAQELRTDRLRDHDPNVPLVVCARAAKPG
jgi:hypothetical protein